jgi:hypothetical protein
MEQLPGVPPAAFEKEDAEFYDFPRLVTHLEPLKAQFRRNLSPARTFRHFRPPKRRACLESGVRARIQRFQHPTRGTELAENPQRVGGVRWPGRQRRRCRAPPKCSSHWIEDVPEDPIMVLVVGRQLLVLRRPRSLLQVLFCSEGDEIDEPVHQAHVGRGHLMGGPVCRQTVRSRSFGRPARPLNLAHLPRGGRPKGFSDGDVDNRLAVAAQDGRDGRQSIS